MWGVLRQALGVTVGKSKEWVQTHLPIIQILDKHLGGMRSSIVSQVQQLEILRNEIEEFFSMKVQGLIVEEKNKEL